MSWLAAGWWLVAFVFGMTGLVHSVTTGETRTTDLILFFGPLIIAHIVTKP